MNIIHTPESGIIYLSGADAGFFLSVCVCGGGSNVLGLHAKGGGPAALGPMLWACIAGQKGGGRPLPPGSATAYVGQGRMT